MAIHWPLQSPIICERWFSYAAGSYACWSAAMSLENWSGLMLVCMQMPDVNDTAMCPTLFKCLCVYLFAGL